MAPNSKQRKPVRPPSPDMEGTGAKPPVRQLMIWALLLMLFFSLFHMASQGRSGAPERIRFNPEFMQLAEQKKIHDAEVVTETSGQQYITGSLTEIDDHSGKRKKFRTDVVVYDELPRLLMEKGIPFEFKTQNPMMWQILSGVVPFLLVMGLLYFLVARQMRMAGRGAMNFGKSRAKLLARTKNRITFNDVAGIDEAREEVQEIVEFLRDPKRFQKLGGRIPKGVLLVGHPGTGKTLLARAIAGEANVPFFSISGSDFVEMFVGVGASRVRDMFEQAKKSAPCIIFIDEIDAVGRSRFSGIGGGHDEREQTLNALLVEMDGFDAQEGIIIIAATNRPDVLDPALLRPGRFDRQIVVDLPSLEGREKILLIHSRKIKLSADVELRRIARGTPGFSGADLANLINEAALLAARRGAEAVEMEDMEEARDKVRWGRERRSRMLDDKEKKLTAYHEAGHALVLQLLDADPLHKVTIIPRGQALGATMQLPEKDRYTESQSKLHKMITGLMGGRTAEELVFGDVTTGAQMDFRQATHIARMMVCEWGMSSLGPQNFGEKEEVLFLGREISRSQNHSEETARRIDAEVTRILTEANDEAHRLIREHFETLHAIARALVERETLDGRDVEDIVKFGHIRTDADRAAEALKSQPPPSAPPAAADAAVSTPSDMPPASHPAAGGAAPDSLPA